MADVEIYACETEGWPHDGRRSVLRWSAAAGFVRHHTSRHIDADDESCSVSALGVGEALRWLREAGVSMAQLSVSLAPLLESAALESAVESDGSREERRRLDGVLLLRTVTQTRARPVGAEERQLRHTLPLLGRALGAARDRLYDRREAPVREVVSWSWGDEPTP